jgi:two-component system, cell cycle sensor histidine kinase and response regulator CckA
MYGWSSEEVENKLLPIVPEDQLEPCRARRAKVMSGESFTQYEATRRRKDGSSIEVSISTAPIYDKDGRISAILGVHMDITERRKAEEARRLSELRYRAVFEQATDAIIVHDLKGNLVDFNDVAAVHSGWTREELIGKSVFDFLMTPEREEIFELWDNLPMHEPVMIEKVHRRKDGTSLPAEVKIAKVLFDDQPMILAVVRDLTERKEQERQRERLNSQLVQAQKMESVGRLAGGVAHDFNNMLSVINGYAELVLDELPDYTRLRQRVEAILTAGRQSATIVHQLLAFARKQTITPQILDLNSALEDMLKMLRNLIGENIDLVWKPGSGLWKVRIDPTQLNQMLANLALNARDSIADVGRVTIETTNVVLNQAFCDKHAGNSPGEYVRLGVIDTGCGMDESTCESIFEPFYTTKGKGTGLGLATVYGIVKQNDGIIVVHSEPGKGSTFRVYLPRHHCEPAEATRSASDWRDPKRRRDHPCRRRQAHCP